MLFAWYSNTGCLDINSCLILWIITRMTKLELTKYMFTVLQIIATITVI